MAKNEFIPIIVTALILVVAASLGALLTATSWESMYSLAFATLFYVVLPGYCVLLNFNLSGLERIIFGMPVSIALVSLTLYTIDIFGFALSARNIVFVILGICIASILIKTSFAGKSTASI